MYDFTLSLIMFQCSGLWISSELAGDFISFEAADKTPVKLTCHRWLHNHRNQMLKHLLHGAPGTYVMRKWCACCGKEEVYRVSVWPFKVTCCTQSNQHCNAHSVDKEIKRMRASLGTKSRSSMLGAVAVRSMDRAWRPPACNRGSKPFTCF